MSYEDQLRRWEWIQLNLNAGVAINNKVLQEKFEVAESTAKLDFKYFTDRELIRYKRSENSFEIIDKLKPLPNLFFSQQEWVALLMAEQVLTHQPSTIAGQLMKMINRYKEQMAAIASEKTIRQNISSCLTNIEQLDTHIFQHCLYALFRQEVLRFSYFKLYDKNQSTRTVSPQHLVCHDGKWIMVSWDHSARALRNFMPSRISEIKTDTEKPFHPVDPREIALHLNSAYGIFKGKQTAKVELLFSEQFSVWAYKQFWHDQAIKTWQDNRLKLTLPIAGETGILQDILKYGVDVEVLSPKSLREKVKLTLKKMSQMYE